MRQANHPVQRRREEGVWRASPGTSNRRVNAAAAPGGEERRMPPTVVVTWRIVCLRDFGSGSGLAAWLGDKGPGDVMEGSAARRVRVERCRPAAVTALARRLVERYAAQQPGPHLAGELVRSAATEDVVLRTTLRAYVVRHVLDDARDAVVSHLGHTRGLDRDTR